MTRARAPGKLVLSGAYAVLSGAPAIVTAVSRYVIADTSQLAELVTDEVAAALAPGQVASWVSARAPPSCLPVCSRSSGTPTLCGKRAVFDEPCSLAA